VDNAPFRAPGFVLSQFVKSRSMGVNYLLGVGPTKDGEFVDGIYQNMAIVGDWMKQNAAAVKGTKPLPATESASVPAVTSGSACYLFAAPQFKEGGSYENDLLAATDETLTLKGVSAPTDVKILRDGSSLKYSYSDQTVTITLPASKRTKLVDVVKVEL